MEIRLLTDIDYIKSIYRTRLVEDFAANERRPWSSLKKLWKSGRYDCFGLFDGGELAAYGFFAKLEQDGQRLYLFDYLAVSRDRRDQGVGSLFLKMLNDRLADADFAVGEVEDPNAAEDEPTKRLRQRRLDFYLRAGYRDTGVTARVYGVDYRLLEIPTGREHTPEEIQRYYTAIYESFLPAVFLKQHFRVNVG